MTVSSEQSRVQYATDGVATSFPVPFRFLRNRDLRVTLIHDQDGTTHELVLDSDYTLSGANQAAGGTLTTTTTLASGQTLIVERVMSITQETAYQRNDPFPERAHEQALDRLTMIAQQFESWLGTLPGALPRVLHFPIEFPRRQTSLPAAHIRARKALIFDALGNVTVGKDNYEDQAANAAQSASEAAASAAAAHEDREIVEQIANDFGDLDAARDQWEAAVQQSQTAANSAQADADRAETAANIAAASARIYDNVAQGLAHTTDGQYFSVPAASPIGFLDLYRNSSGNGVFINTLPDAEAVEIAIQLGYQKNGFGRLPGSGFGSQWIDSISDEGGGVFAGIDERGRTRGTFEPGDQYTRYPSEGFASKRSLDTVNSQGEVISKIDEQGLLRINMCPDDQLVRMPSEGFNDDQKLANRAPDSGVLSYYDQNGRLRGVFVPDDDVSRYPSEGFDDGFTFIEIDRDGRIFAVYPNDGNGSTTPSSPTVGPYFQIDTTAQSLTWAWRASATEMIRLRWQPNGYNNLFNYRARDRAIGSDAALASWVERHQTNSDGISPKIIEAENGDDAPYGPIYTGGNHGSSGSAGGLQTARMVSWIVTVDGRRLKNGESFEGYADLVEVAWVNELMAFNTIGLTPSAGRYVWRQSVTMRCRIGGPEIIETDSALPGETVSVRQDNFTQSFISGSSYDSTAHFYDGQQAGPFPYVANPSPQVSSGSKSGYPSWAAVFTGTDGIHAVWGDRQYEAGDGRYLRGTAGFFRLSGIKLYSNIVGGGGVPYPTFSNGEGYSMRGGYSYGLSADAEGIDSAFLIPKREQLQLAYSLVSAGSGRAHVPEFYVNRCATGGQLIGPSGVAVSASEYKTATLPLEVIK